MEPHECVEECLIGPAVERCAIRKERRQVGELGPEQEHIDREIHLEEQDHDRNERRERGRRDGRPDNRDRRRRRLVMLENLLVTE